MSSEDVDQTSTIVSQSNIFPSLFSLFNPQLYTQELMVSVGADSWFGFWSLCLECSQNTFA
jgi:hypothetical protein